jgi:hypothetical protein
MLASMNILNIGGGMLSNATGDVKQTHKMNTGPCKRTREAVRVDGAKETVKAAAMLRVLREVLVDHVERRLEHSIEHRRHLRC